MKHLLPVRRTIFYLREYFFPCGCSCCGTSLDGVEEAWYGLCGTCRAGIERDFAERRKLCDYCGKPLISEQGRCLRCRQAGPRSFDQVTVLFPYWGKYRRLIGSYKFQHNLAAGNFFAEHIRTVLNSGMYPPGAQLVPVPPRPRKIRESGWDQIEYLVHLLEQRFAAADFPAVNRCLRRLPSQSQKKLGLENRRNNLRGRITPVRQVPKTAVVIDDVMTTGSTLDACAAALKEAGTETVYGLCLFYD